MTGHEVEPVSEAEEEERKRRQRIAQFARNFLVHLATLIRQLRVHRESNQAVRKHLVEVQADVEALRREDTSLAFVFAQGHAFVNGVWVRATRMVWEHALMLTDALQRVDCRGVVLEQGLKLETLLRLAILLRERLDAGDAGEEPAGIDPGLLPGLRLIPLSSDKDRRRGGRAEARRNAFEILREGLTILSPSEITRLDLFMRRRQRALVHRLVQMAEDSPEDLLALTTLRDPSLPAGSHNLMVTILAIALGRLVGMRRRDLVRLGIAALNHNLGESLLPPDVLDAPRALTEEERGVIERHPLLGMRYILRHHGFEIPMVERALASAEHHLHWDGAGGYAVQLPEHLHPFSRIIAAADVLHALLSERPHRSAYPADQAVKLLLRRAGVQLDPVLTRALVRLVGKHPPGSLVELDTGAWGIVLGPGRGSRPLERPRVLLITDEDGFELERPFVVDLGERHPRRRAWLRTIARTRDPGRLGIRVTAYLYADRLEVEPDKLDSDLQPGSPTPS